MRAARRFGNLLQSIEQFGDIRRTVAMLAGIACGKQAGRSIECIDANTGIVAECGQTADACCVARAILGPSRAIRSDAADSGYDSSMAMRCRRASIRSRFGAN